MVFNFACACNIISVIFLQFYMYRVVGNILGITKIIENKGVSCLTVIPQPMVSATLNRELHCFLFFTNLFLSSFIACCMCWLIKALRLRVGISCITKMREEKIFSKARYLLLLCVLFYDYVIIIPPNCVVCFHMLELWLQKLMKSAMTGTFF